MMGERTVMQEALCCSFSLEQHVPMGPTAAVDRQLCRSQRRPTAPEALLQRGGQCCSRRTAAPVMPARQQKGAAAANDAGITSTLLRVSELIILIQVSLTQREFFQ
jgi:hypothetical protein